MPHGTVRTGRLGKKKKPLKKAVRQKPRKISRMKGRIKEPTIPSQQPTQPTATEKPLPDRTTARDVLSGIDKAGQKKEGFGAKLKRGVIAIEKFTGTGIQEEDGVKTLRLQTQIPGLGGLGKTGLSAAAKRILAKGGTLPTRAAQTAQVGTGRQTQLSQILLKTTKESKALAKLGKPTPTGTLTKVNGVVSNVQSNSKTGRLIKDTLQKAVDLLLTSKKVVTTTNPLTGVVTTAIISSRSFTKPLAIAAIVIGGAVWLADKSIGGKNFGNFLRQEGAAPINGAIITAQRSGTYEDLLEALAMRDEMTALIRENNDDMTPYTNVADGLLDFADITDGATDLIRRIETDKELARLNGEDPDSPEYWAKKRIQEIEDEQSSRNDFDARARILVKFREDAKAAGDLVSAKLWADEAAKQRVLELKQQKEIVALWAEYRRVASQISQTSSSSFEAPSRLNFGLI